MHSSESSTVFPSSLLSVWRHLSLALAKFAHTARCSLPELDWFRDANPAMCLVCFCCLHGFARWGPHWGVAEADNAPSPATFQNKNIASQRQTPSEAYYQHLQSGQSQRHVRKQRRLWRTFPIAFHPIIPSCAPFGDRRRKNFWHPFASSWM